MKKLDRKWIFTPSMVHDAPDTPGLYALWDEQRLLLIGRATGGKDTIRARLTAHLERLAARPGAPSPTHYSWEICLDPAQRHAALEAL